MAAEELAIEFEPDQERDRQILERILSLKQFIEVDGGEARDYHELGICYYYIKNYDQAAVFLEQLFEKHPEYPGLVSGYGLHILCKISAGHIAEALEFAEEYLVSMPTDIKLLAMKAHCLDKLGKQDAAIEIHRSIIDLDAGNINSLNSLGYLLSLRGGDADMPEALGYLKQVISMKSEHPAYLDSFGVYLMKQGNYKSAKKAFGKALGQLPENAEILDHFSELVSLQKEGP